MNYDILKKENLKLTLQRKLIIDIINNLDSDATIKNILAECKDRINKSTVYRIIELFIEKNIISTNINVNNLVYYTIRSSHNHYFTCIVCYKKKKLDFCPIKIIKDKIEEKENFKITNHTISINGICKDCQNI